VPVDDGGGEIDQFAVGDTRLLAQHREGAFLVDGVAFHEDALRAFGQRAAPERALEVVIFGEAAQHDIDRALPVLDVVVTDVGEHAPLGRFLDERGIWRVQQHDHGAGGLTHDLVDQSQRVLRIRSESDERDVGPFAGGPSLSTSGETLTIEESMTLRARAENAGHVGDEQEWSGSS